MESKDRFFFSVPKTMGISPRLRKVSWIKFPSSWRAAMVGATYAVRCIPIHGPRNAHVCYEQTGGGYSYNRAGCWIGGSKVELWKKKDGAAEGYPWDIPWELRILLEQNKPKSKPHKDDNSGYVSCIQHVFAMSDCKKRMSLGCLLWSRIWIGMSCVLFSSTSRLKVASCFEKIGWWSKSLLKTQIPEPTVLWRTSRTTFLLTGRLFSFPKDFCCGAREHREAAVAHGALPKLLALLNADGEVGDGTVGDPWRVVFLPWTSLRIDRVKKVF